MQKDELNALGKLQSHAVAGLKSEALQIACRFIDQFIQFRIGEALKRRVNELKRDLVREFLDVFSEGV